MSRPPFRTAGILLPAFSPRRQGDLGIGDTRALREWIDWAAEHQVGFIQLLPINESGAEDSPYSAISSVALDPIYLTFDPPEIPGLTEHDLAASRSQLHAAIAAPRVDYRVVRREKRDLLEIAWGRWPQADEALKCEFAAFRVAEAGWLDDYCLFRWLMETHGEALSWDKWPDGCHTPAGAHRYLARQRALDAESVDFRLGYHAFAQWLCFRQWRAVRAHADQAGVKLMGDIPIGVSWHSCDTFFERDLFHLEWSGGAPEESLFAGDEFLRRWGQNWGIPLYRWNRMARDDYDWWRRRVRRHLEIFSMFRLDHILGFYRIYAFPWRPEQNAEFAKLNPDQVAAVTGKLPRWIARPDDTPEHRAANLADGTPRIAAVADEARDAEIIAEDLGWTPDYVRPHLESLGIAGFRIPHWDSDGQGHPIPGHSFPECSFATYSTHDHDPINRLWNTCQRDSGSPGANHALTLLAKFAGVPLPHAGQWPRFTNGIKWRLFKALFDSRSRYAQLSVAELFDIEERINTPGSGGDANWRFRLPWNLTEIRTHPALGSVGYKLASIIGATRRGTPGPA